MQRNHTAITEADRDALRGILPWLSAQPQAVKAWRNEQSFGYPEYTEEVHTLRQALASAYWRHVDYAAILQAAGANDLSPGPALITSMSLDELCAAITAFHRGERFVDGHMAAQIESGAALALVSRALAHCDEVLGEKGA